MAVTGFCLGCGELGKVDVPENQYSGVPVPCWCQKEKCQEMKGRFAETVERILSEYPLRSGWRNW